MKTYFTQKDVKVLDIKTLYQGHFSLKRLKLQYRLFEGGWSKQFDREIFERGDSVGILLLDPLQDKLVLIEQFRAAILFKTEHPWILEIAAGVVNENESTEAVAHRESQEETGLSLYNLHFIQEYWVSPGGSSEKISLYCGHVDANQAQGIQGLIDEGEDIRLHVMPLKKAYQLVNEGKINNASTLIALLWLQQNEAQIKREFNSSEK